MRNLKLIRSCTRAAVLSGLTLALLTGAGSTWVDSYLSVFIAPVEWLHASAGLPWWSAIAAASLGYRLVTAPIIFNSVRATAVP